MQNSELILFLMGYELNGYASSAYLLPRFYTYINL